jgi:2-polyprenyl-3-methyl-5-hydroxy-6-metoxy-1,4-benzoquinol methylase
MNPENLNTAHYWDNVYQAEWESGQVLSGDYSRDYGPIHDAILRLIPAGSSVLDVACGTGLLCRKIQQRVPGAKVLGVDFSNYTIARNQERDRALGVEYQCVDVRTGIPGIPRVFDVVTMCEILEHLEEPERVVAEALSRLKPGGLFILTCPHDNAIPDPEHLRTWSHDELFHLLAPYSETVAFTHFPPPYFHIWMMAHLAKSSSPAGETATT